MNAPFGFPEKQGLYDPSLEKDSCGVGFVAHIKGKPSHQIVMDAYTILKNMEHRGACGCEQNTGDGAGILVGMPDKFLRRVALSELGINLPKPGVYSVGNIFLPKDSVERDHCKQVLNRLIAAEGQKLLGWRAVPQEAKIADIGPAALKAEPVIEQVFIAAKDGLSQQ